MCNFQSLLLLSLLCVSPLLAQSSDNGDGTFTNPVLWADMPDPDVTQVGDTFYMVTTSMHMLPGVTIVQSTDLVNWQFAANVVPQFDDDPYFDLQGGNRYARGQWATALNYWGGEFHVLFTSNSNGTYIYSSPSMAGKWHKTTLYDAPFSPYLDRYTTPVEQEVGDGYYHHALYDPGFLVDHDGRVYVVHGNTENFITEIDPVSCQAKTPAKLLYRRHREGLEGNRPYHIGDYYYVICTYGGSSSGNVTCMRSRSLDGPWEEREVMCTGARMPQYHILQACLIPLASGQTWAMAFLNMGSLGRIPHLVPVHWQDGWPLFGDWANGNLTLSKPLIRPGQTLPDARPTGQTLATSDDFSTTELGLQWQFNHNPEWSQVSLTERPGYLRLHALLAHQPLPRQRANNHYITTPGRMSESSVEVSREAPLLMARNTLTQRLFGPYSQGTAHVDASHLKVGDRAGLALLNIPYATLTLSRTGKGFVLAQTVGDNQQELTIASVMLTEAQSHNIWLRADTEAYPGTATFSYSTDGQHFETIGNPYQMQYSGDYFVGNRYALFCYNSQRRRGGWLDVDDFQVAMRPLFDRQVKSGTTLQAEWTDALWRTECRWSAVPGAPATNMDIAYTDDGGIVAFNGLQYQGPIHQVNVTLRNVSAQHAFVELSDAVTGQVLGTVEIPEPAKQYVTLPVVLQQPLVNGHRIEFRVWGHDWDQPKLGEVFIDSFSFE